MDLNKEDKVDVVVVQIAVGWQITAVVVVVAAPEAVAAKVEMMISKTNADVFKVLHDKKKSCKKPTDYIMNA